MTILWALAILGPVAYVGAWLWGWHDGEDLRWQVPVACLVWTAVFSLLALRG